MAIIADTSTSSKTHSAEPIVGLGNLNLISQGAEARVYEGSFLGKPTIFKQRFSKKYRHSALDVKLTQARFRQEVRTAIKARKLGILAPAIYFAEHDASTIYMEKVQGCTVKELLLPGVLEAAGLAALLKEIGIVVAKLHDGGLVHGDLTTSNIMVRHSDKALVLIDFGLSSNSTLAEDKAVDLYVLERAVTSTLVTDANVFNQIVTAYRQSSKNWCPVLNKFAEVRMRGRKRAMVG